MDTLVAEQERTKVKQARMLERLEHLTELPLMILALVMVPLTLGPMLWDLSAEGEQTVNTLNLFIWALFTVDLLAKVAVAPDRWGYIRKHPLDLVIVALPFLRPLRLLRLFVYGFRVAVGARRMMSVDSLLLYAIALIVITATIVTTVEDNVGGSIRTFPDALWWAMATITTIGYGDAVPVTPMGRAVAVVLMVGGITLFSALTANIAAFIVKVDNTGAKEKEGAQQAEALDRLTKEVEALRREVARLRQ